MLFSLHFILFDDGGQQLTPFGNNTHFSKHELPCSKLSAHRVLCVCQLWNGVGWE